MQTGNLTREQVVALVGVDVVNALDYVNYEPSYLFLVSSCAVWSSSISATTIDGDKVTVTAYYYTTQEEFDLAGDDHGKIDWEIAGYDIT